MLERQGGLFRKQALERLSSPERLDELLVVLRRRDWLLLSTAATVVAAAVAWAAFGRIPLYAEGKAVLIRPGAVAPIAARDAGVIARLDLTVGGRVEAGAPVAWLRQPLLEQRTDEQRARVERLRAQHEALRASQEAAHAVERGGALAQRERAARRLVEARAAAEAARTALLAAVGDDRRRAAQLDALARAHLAAALERQAALRTLRGSGAASEQAVLEADRVVVAAGSALGDLDLRALTLSTTEAAAEQSYVEALHRALELEDALVALDAEEAGRVRREAELAASQALALDDARAALATLERELAEACTVRCERGGTVLEVAVVPGDHVAPGTRVASIEVDGAADAPLVALCFFDVKGGKLVEPGMRVELTPDMVERERFGGIVGRVQHVEAFPVSTAAAASLLGQRELAASLTAEGRRIQLLATLEPAPANPSGVAWTLSGGPALRLSAGTTGDVRARVETVAPAALILPALRRLLQDDEAEGAPR